MRKEIKERIEKIRNGDIPEGYKHTKLGVLPNRWDILKLDKIFNISSGKSLSRSQLGDEGIANLHYGDIHKANKSYLNIEDIKELPKIKKPLDYFNKNQRLEDGDVVFADASEDYSDIGKAVLIENPIGIPFVGGLHTIIAKDPNGYYYKEFKKYLFQISAVKKELKFYATGISVLGISQKNIKKVSLVRPALNEQKKIAYILTIWDKAIEMKQELLEKKKQLKKGLMQRLLTGELRLPGFDGEWRNYRLKDIVEYSNSKSLKKYFNNESGHSVISIGNYSKRGKYIDNNTYIKINKELEKYVLKKNDLAMVLNDKTKYGGILGTVLLIDEDNKYIFNQRTARLQPNSEISDSSFLFYLLNSNRFKLKVMKISQGSTQIYINKGPLLNLKTNLPPLIEQKAIAEVLSTADKSIELIEKQIENLKLQKKGLMQLLLTGIVRVNDLDIKVN